MKDKYILDSSVWVQIERRNAHILHVVDPLIAQNAVCIVDVIVAELLRGTRTRTDYLRLRKAFADFVQLRTTWEHVADLAFRVARRGYQPPLIDLYIAQCAIDHTKTVVTQDNHFRHIARVEPFGLIFLPQNT